MTHDWYSDTLVREAYLALCRAQGYWRAVSGEPSIDATARLEAAMGDLIAAAMDYGRRVTMNNDHAVSGHD